MIFNGFLAQKKLDVDTFLTERGMPVGMTLKTLGFYLIFLPLSNFCGENKSLS
jgi:hypothetical protein